MRIDILTLFPEMFDGLNSSIIKRAKEKKAIELNVINYRPFTNRSSMQVDDYGYGGGAGMIISVQPIVDCLKSIPNYQSATKILTLPGGIKYHQEVAKSLSNNSHLIIICGHYEGIDYRILDYVDMTISIGDFILTGGEIVAMAIVDSVTRLIPGVLNNSESKEDESFNDDLLEYPQYTRPEEYDGKRVPDVLLSGHHQNIQKWRHMKALEETFNRRPDLLEKANLTEEDKHIIKKLQNGDKI